jgi:prepilin-type N-terminal cleavage/methylation domain-containing protein
MATFMNHRAHQGFTLVEMIMVIALNTILMVVITGSILSLYKNHGYTYAQSNEIDAARRSVSDWMRDAREMTPAANGAFPIVTTEPHRFGFYSDIDRDFGVEYVEFVVVGTNLYRYTYNPIGYPATYNTAVPDEIHLLSEYVQNLNQGETTFHYYNGTGALLASPAAMISDIRYIEMRVIVNIDPLRSPGEFMLKGSVAPRNLKDNL